MKYIIIATLILISLGIGIAIGMRIKQQRHDAEGINRQFMELLDDVAYSYGPLKFMKSGELDKAKSLLLPRLGDSLQRFNEFIDLYPAIQARNMKMIDNAQELYDTEMRTEQPIQSTCGTRLAFLNRTDH